MRIIYFIVGLITLAIGAIGAVLPMLPSFPFLLLSAICFAKSSKRMHDWLVETNIQSPPPSPRNRSSVFTKSS